MIVPENLLKKLRQIFDLNIYEVKIWAALLSKGVSSAGELADISGVPRSRSYDVLETLEKKGFVVMKLGKPIKYLAVHPEEVIVRIKSNIKDKAEEHVKELNKVNKSDIYSELELLYKQGIEKVEPTDMSGLLKGRKNLNDHLKFMINNAKESVILVTTAPGILRKADALKSALKKAKERGVSIKIAAPVEDKTKLAELLKVAEVRHYDGQKARFVIVDGNQVVFMTADDEEVHEAYDSGVWINTAFFASAFKDMFENTWQGLKDL
ncbi:MAG: hypothetical protein KKA65_03980 [Nanoarchaeota archaeon]|nr:hypothetical protein [Nanoarchaeota archaeon]MBU4242231.1 hypothetical protein [Nanoarchaeota archaeon]MBU4351595.1 hypothetical protein [Nanoarchaeota archaeon]MBU4456636.1 hypothetical protein [Nanoarchaeota archaeon]MCG2719509.1 hypothetical protein [Nanoarchaeota archaeon]